MRHTYTLTYTYRKIGFCFHLVLEKFTWGLFIDSMHVNTQLIWKAYLLSAVLRRNPALDSLNAYLVYKSNKPTLNNRINRRSKKIKKKRRKKTTTPTVKKKLQNCKINCQIDWCSLFARFGLYSILLVFPLDLPFCPRINLAYLFYFIFFSFSCFPLFFFLFPK